MDEFMRQLEAELEEYFQLQGLEIETFKIIDVSHIYLEHNYLPGISYMLQVTILQHYVIYPVTTSWSTQKAVLEGVWHLHDKRYHNLLQPTFNKTLTLPQIVAALKQLSSC